MQSPQEPARKRHEEPTRREGLTPQVLLPLDNTQPKTLGNMIGSGRLYVEESVPQLGTPTCFLDLDERQDLLFTFHNTNNEPTDDMT